MDLEVTQLTQTVSNTELGTADSPLMRVVGEADTFVWVTVVKGSGITSRAWRSGQSRGSEISNGPALHYNLDIGPTVLPRDSVNILISLGNPFS